MSLLSMTNDASWSLQVLGTGDRGMAWSNGVPSNNRWRGAVMRGLFGAAGPGRNGGPAAPVGRGRPAPQLHR
jgi:hypothetical protein